MAWQVPDVGEVALLARVLYSDADAENISQKLYSNNVVFAESDVAGTYTEATFTGYSAKTLTSYQSGATWAVPTTAAGVTSSAYGTASVWSPTTSQTIYEQILVGATSTILLAVDAFAAGLPLANGGTLTITPAFGAA